MTPQFGRRTHRAREHMEALGRHIPDLWSLVEQVRLANMDNIGSSDWPQHCYLPLEHAGVIATMFLRAQRVAVTPTQAARLGSQIAALSAWRMTQGIYRYDAALYPALIGAPVNGDLPATLIQSLPEWCVYIETPDLTVPSTSGDLPLRGTYAWLDRARGTTHDILTLLLDADSVELTVTHVPLIGTMHDALSRVADDWRDAHARGNAPTLPPDGFAEMARNALTPIAALVMYLCTEPAEITGRQGAPGNPRPVRTRRHGMKLFPADGPTYWDVGTRAGAQLRTAYQREQFAGDISTGDDVPEL